VDTKSKDIQFFKYFHFLNKRPQDTLSRGELLLIKQKEIFTGVKEKALDDLFLDIYNGDDGVRKS
jgi:hypothetical protein